MGQKRNDLGLADLFGVRFRGRAEGPMHNSYLRLAHAAPGAEVLLKGLANTRRELSMASGCGCRSTQASAPAPLTLIPSYPDLPMEKVYPREPASGRSKVFCGVADGDEWSIFPWDIDRAFWEYFASSTANCSRTRGMGDGRRTARLCDRTRTLEVTLGVEHSVAIHLVNLDESMAMKGPFVIDSRGRTENSSASAGWS